MPARRAMVRWAWRLLRREWRQQLLILALVVIAVGVTIVASAVASNSPAPARAGYGTAQAKATFPGTSPSEARELAYLRAHDGPVQVIEDQTFRVPGSVDTYELRAESPHGRFSGPMLSLVSGRYPSGPSQVAMTAGLASELRLSVGEVWHQGGTSGPARRLVGIVQNPQSLLDEFALVVPGQVTSPTVVTVLLDTRGRGRLPANVFIGTPPAGAFNPETFSIAGLTIGMILIALVSVGGFTVLAQRRLRSFGMLQSLGATDRQVSLVVRANGALVGAVGAVIGAVLGIGLWLAYRPELEQSSHHLIGTWALSWPVVIVAMVLALVATYFGARRPARALTRIPVVSALSGRPPEPRQVRRSFVPGLVCLAIAFIVLGFSGASSGSAASGSSPQLLELVVGLVLLIPGIILLSPFFLGVLARLGRRAPVQVRLALRDMSRYRARSGAALAAISLGILIAVIVSLVSAARYGNVLDYVGPNLSSNQLVVYTPAGPYGVTRRDTVTGSGSTSTGAAGGPQTAAQAHRMSAAALHIARSVGASDEVALLATAATLVHAAPGRNFSGPVYVATPQLLHAFGINPSQVDPRADVLTVRPGLSTISKMQLFYGGFGGKGPGAPGSGYPCPKGSCLANPMIQEIPALPPGTSAPNTVITEHAVRTLGLHTVVAGWMIQSPHPLSANQIDNARVAAASADLTVETKNSAPTSAEITNYATIFGIALALAILAMSVGLIRSETASDLRTLTATGASSRMRRTLTATTAGALALVGAVLGTGAGYLAVIGYMRSNTFEGGLSSLGGAVPVWDLVGILVAMPLAAAIGGWLLGGRQPPGVARQPIE